MPQQENSSSFYRDLEQRLEQLRQQGQWRELRRSDYGLPEMTFEGTRYLNLSSNDYLGLANDAALRGEFLSRVQDTRLGATGSRLMTGNTLPYADFEQQLERTYGLPALVFGSGYHANTGVLPALVSSGDLVLADRLVHASILDGVLASKADFQRYRHNDYEHLETLLARNRSRYRYVWIVSETIFSMAAPASLAFFTKACSAPPRSPRWTYRLSMARPARRASAMALRPAMRSAPRGPCSRGALRFSRFFSITEHLIF